MPSISYWFFVTFYQGQTLLSKAECCSLFIAWNQFGFCKASSTLSGNKWLIVSWLKKETYFESLSLSLSNFVVFICLKSISLSLDLTFLEFRNLSFHICFQAQLNSTYHYQISQEKFVFWSFALIFCKTVFLNATEAKNLTKNKIVFQCT